MKEIWENHKWKIIIGSVILVLLGGDAAVGLLAVIVIGGLIGNVISKNRIKRDEEIFKRIEEFFNKNDK